jgi:hypothetical protein
MGWEVTDLEMLEWCIRLTYIGMPPAYIRMLMLKKHAEMLKTAADKASEATAKICEG